MTPNGMLLDVYVRVSPKEKKKKKIQQTWHPGHVFYPRYATGGICIF